MENNGIILNKVLYFICDRVYHYLRLDIEKGF